MSDMLLLPIRPLLQRTITAMEAIYDLPSAPWSANWDGETLTFGRASQVPEELFKLRDSSERSTLEALARFVWKCAAVEKQITVWFLRNASPEAAMIFLLCTVSEVPLDKLMSADLSEAQLYRLMSVMSQLTASTLMVSETPEDGYFGERLGIAHWGQGAEVCVCDWNLSEEELQAAQESGLQILATGDPGPASD